jgi:HD superfamily phosphohydrolase
MSKLFHTPQKRLQFIDSVHGTLPLDEPVVRHIVRSRAFQRLRKIHQLDCDDVFVGATHTRFAHSLGTYHITKVWLAYLKQFSPFNTVQEWRDTALVIKVAALAHDLGHIAFSHLLDDLLVEQYGCVPHEERSVALLRAIPDIDRYLSPEQLNLAGRIILGDHSGGSEPKFVYQMVNNKFTDLDADKIDYLLRDSGVTNKKVTFDWRDLIFRSKLVEGELCFHAQLARNIHQLFYSRYNMFLEVYLSPECVGYRMAKRDLILEYLQHHESEFLALLNSAEGVLTLTDDWFWQQLEQDPNTAALVEKLRRGEVGGLRRCVSGDQKEGDERIKISYRYTNQSEHPILLVKFYQDDSDETFHMHREDLPFDLPRISQAFAFLQRPCPSSSPPPTPSDGV